MSWLEVIPAFFSAVLVLLAPGLAIGYFINLRSLWLWALAPVISATVYAAASLALFGVGIQWTITSVSVFTIAFGALIVCLFRFALPEKRWPSSNRRGDYKWIALSSVISGSILTFHFVAGIGSPGNISQTFDNVFHLNAIEFVSSSGVASPFGIGLLTSPEDVSGFYPMLWHALVELGQQFTGVDIASAIHASNLAVMWLAWGPGVILLVRQLAGRSTFVTVSAGIMAAAFPAFPLNMLSYGVLYPYFFGIALLPTALSVLLVLLGHSRDESAKPRAATSVLLLGLIPGITLAHPVAFMTLLALSVPLVLVAFGFSWKPSHPRTRLWLLLGLAFYGLIGLVLLYVLRPGVMWPARTSTADALWRTLSLGLEGFGIPILIAALTLTGLCVSLIRRTRPGIAAVGIWFVVAVLHFLIAGVDQPFMRGITGVWYGDTPRISAVLPLAAIPLAVTGLKFLADKIGSVVRLQRSVISGVLLLTVLIVTQISAGYSAFLNEMNRSHRTDDASVLLTADERELLSRVSKHVAEDELIIGSPWTGTSLAYAFSGRDVLLPHILMEIDGDRQTILEGLDRAETTPAVCDALREINAVWLLDFGTQEVHGARHTYEGLDTLQDGVHLELVDEEGAAKLYRVVACV